jgi:hypothetical protein
VTTPHIHEASFEPGDNGSKIPLDDDDTGQEQSNWQVIFGAPDYTTLVKPKSTAVAREYRDKTYSMLKAVLIGAINTGDMADAATIVQHGPAFGQAIGQLANSDERTRRTLDFLTAPSNPYMTALMVALPFFSQLFRNHEKALQELPNNIRMTRRQRKAMRAAQSAEPPRFTAHILGRDIPIRWRNPVRLSGVGKILRTQTADPALLVDHVFQDERFLKALADQGILLIKVPTNDKM